jgi:iron-sulfur cluster assembly protein
MMMGGYPMISLTEAAQQELERIMKVEGHDKSGVRLGVRGGGCSGFTYVMDFVDQPAKADQVINAERVPVVIDPKSMTYLNGIQIDFENDILNRGFRFNNPNATQSCGCGTSFAV